MEEIHQGDTDMNSVRPSLSKFRGCLMGALAGDCLGAVFEGAFYGVKVPSGHFQRSVQEHFSRKSQNLERKGTKFSHRNTYTDDTAMALSLMESLADCDGLDPKDLAKKFSEAFFEEPNRGYGGSIAEVFRKLRDSGYANPFQPASEQFSGTGSYGNGGAMRVAPVALFNAKSLPNTIQAAKNQCLITHTHPDAVMGGILQATAVFIALNSGEGVALKSQEFMEKLQKAVAQESQNLYGENEKNPYFEKFGKFDQLISDQTPSWEIGSILGNGIAAIDSVPTAIFSFVHCLLPTSDIQVENPLLRTLVYAVSIGGDTDTIGTMAGAICGAYYGDSYVPKVWSETLEKFDKIREIADLFYEKNSGGAQKAEL